LLSGPCNNILIIINFFYEANYFLIKRNPERAMETEKSLIRSLKNEKENIAQKKVQ
jgi:hypothetical protein